MFETKMLALKPTSVALFCCFLAVYFFPDVNKHRKEMLCKRKVIQHCHLLPICIHILRYREKYLKRRTVYSACHPGSYNPSVITNQEAHTIYGNMERTASSTSSNQKCKTTKKAKTISDYFSAAAPDCGGK